MGRQSLRPVFQIRLLWFIFVITSTVAIGQTSKNPTPATSAFVYAGTCPSSCNQQSSQISGFAVAADGSAQPIPGSPFSAASAYLTANANFLFAVGGSTNQRVFTYAPGSNGSLTQAGVVNGLGPVNFGGEYVFSLSPDRSGHFLYAGAGCNSCNNYYSSWSISPSGQLTYISEPDQFGDLSAAWGWSLTFSPNDQFAYTGTVAEYNGTLAGFKRNDQGSLTSFSPNPSAPPTPGAGSPLCYSWNSASSSAGYVAVQWWSGLYCNNVPYIEIANYTVNDDGTLALVPGSAIVPAINNLENMAYDPSGHYLAIVGSVGTGSQSQGEIELYKLQSNGTLVLAGPAQLVQGVGNIAWDNANHLYAYTSGSYCAGSCGLYIFNNNNGVLTPAPGSPYQLPNIVSLAALSVN